MKKSSYVAFVLGSISMMLFAFGMCMALVEEWKSLKLGVIVGGIGLVSALVTLLVWRKMEEKPPIKISGKLVGSILMGILGTLTFGLGMVNVMVWNRLVLGIALGLVGILALFTLIPIWKGLKA